MEISPIFEERRHGVRALVDEIPSPSHGDLLDAIDRLDGKNRSSAVFVVDDQTTFTVGGGSGIYVVFVSLGEDAEIYTLNDPRKEGCGEVEIVCGGQLGIYPASQGVNRETTVRALIYFAEHGAVDPELKWQSEWQE